jgi:hypothetical protein
VLDVIGDVGEVGGDAVRGQRHVDAALGPLAVALGLPDDPVIRELARYYMGEASPLPSLAELRGMAAPA